jgi:hypothetical protein
MPGKGLHLHTCALAGAQAPPLQGGWDIGSVRYRALKHPANQIFAPSGRALGSSSRVPFGDAHRSPTRE